MDQIFRPVIFRLGLHSDREAFDFILSEKSVIIHDELTGQLQELVKSLNPSRKLTAQDLSDEINKHLNGKDPYGYGVWVYYPWSNRMVHLLDEDEFLEVRTNRNQYKITRSERDLLNTKRVGIIGLSVGQSIALTLCMERGCTELRLADFDTLELSNLNRIRTGVHNLGVPKVVITAREIAEIDPFLRVKCFFDGLTESNMDTFFLEDGKLDLLIDECDGLDMKIISRYRARELKIPVLMETSDRGMLDIERFDLEPGRPVLHGLISEDINPRELSTLSNEDKIPLIIQIANAQKASVRGRASMIEVGQSINTWPQLASSVVLGGAVSADVTRRMFLGQMVDSGRYYVDLEGIIPNSKAKFKNTVVENPYSPLAKSDMEHLIKQIPANIFIESRIDVPRDILREIVNAGIKAPSTGNDQPWKWYYHNRVLFVFHDQFRSHSFGDYRNIASYLTFGAVYENVVLATHHQRLELNATLFPAGMDSPIVLAFTFSKDKSDLAEPHSHDELANFIPSRCTNRNLSAYKEIDHGILDDLNTVVTSVAGAGLRFLTDATHIQKIGKIIGSFDRMRILNQAGHHDFVNREIRWNATDAERTKDGIDVATLGLNTSQLTALDIIKDFEVINFVNQVKGGKVLEAAAVKSISCASAIGLITMLDKTPESYIMGGRALERLWLAAEKHSLALHPVISPLYFFPREDQQDSGLSDVEMHELKALKKSFLELFNIEDFLTGVFLFKVSYAAKPNIKSLRIPLENMLFID